ncbi:Putative 3,4-dihydroxy-2-butanone 4-phosphate synthase [Candidatus Fokinia solitaria]|uniref:3,4-dihydroxy-2-butanone 4-phosphate synthase n=1 Tax=Candidatus Fokinia solitaria TaxID=1802984 RepID=A0A2U8BRN2_9RICK|nr:3,4-dihydroxy-2-butanone-4-phosphate synthase [Candidatus Fokinia solitaria]AWD32953.1 Putative 3,4-dihydroxy-2-butanone 4-phosphate synthase [Candidatus Fokinia solitaria]
MKHDYHEVKEAVEALQNGLPILLYDAEKENECDVVVAAQAATAEIVNFMVTHCRGLVYVAISASIATKLSLKLQDVRGSNDFTAFTMSVDHIDSTTGISTMERAKTINALADPTSIAHSFKTPGHIFPIIARDGGLKTRKGHTESIVFLMQLANMHEAGAGCEVLDAKGFPLAGNDVFQFASEHKLICISVAQLLHIAMKR